MNLQYIWASLHPVFNSLCFLPTHFPSTTTFRLRRHHSVEASLARFTNHLLFLKFSGYFFPTSFRWNNPFFFCGSPVSLASSFQFVESYSSTSSDHFRVCQDSVSFSSLSCPPSSSFKDFMHAAYTYILTVSSIVFSSGLSYEQCNQAGEEEPHRTSIYFEPLMHCVFFLIHVTFHS